MNGKVKNILVAAALVIACAVASYIVASFAADPKLKIADAFDVPKISVHIKGAVVNPGFYEMEAASRVNDAIAAAGGALEDANLDAVNLAEFLEDGAEVIIPYKTEAASDYTPVVKININTASVQQLSALDGIGPATAEKIVEYRTNRGGFAVKEEIMNVSGIGETLFEKIQNRICVS